jgi:hypothetical protein
MTMHYGLFGSMPTTDDPAKIAELKGYSRGLSKSRSPGAPDLWAVGRANLASGAIDVPISWNDIDRDVAWASKMLDELGVKAGDLCLYSFLYAQSAQFWAFLKAGFDRRSRVATGSAWAWDAYRHEMYLRLFGVRMAFGASEATLDSLTAMGHDPAKVFAGAPILVLLENAADRMRAAGLKPWRLTWLGPIFALDPGDGSGGRFDDAQWELESIDGAIAVTSLGRTTPFERADTGIAGRIETVDGQPRYFAS